MAIASPFLSQPAAPGGFAEALDGLIAGAVGLNLVRRALAAALEQDEGAAAAQALLDDAYQEGQLGAEEYDALTADINAWLGEDVPTEWSEDLVNESAPGSDTLRPGETPAAARTGTALQAGSVLLERFVLQARLGTTGTSDIFKAIDRSRQQAHSENPWVALKLAIPGAPRYEDSLRLLRHEAALARHLEHPHIVRVFDFEQDDGHAFLTMEWLDGESLADLLTRQRYRPLTVAHARQILVEVADALDFAHRQGICHGDVKPGNIFLTRDGRTKLLDFGTARSSTDAPQAADARTPAYASCEVLEDQPPTPQDDLYSLACVAYRMLAGRRVFGHHDALAAENSGRKPAPIRNLPATQSAALVHALAFRRSERTPDIARFMAEFNASPPATAAAHRSPVAVAAEPAITRPLRPAPAPAPAPAQRAPRPGAAVLAAGAVALALGLAAWLTRETPVASPLATPADPRTGAVEAPATVVPAAPAAPAPAMRPDAAATLHGERGASRREPSSREPPAVRSPVPTPVAPPVPAPIKPVTSHPPRVTEAAVPAVAAAEIQAATAEPAAPAPAVADAPADASMHAPTPAPTPAPAPTSLPADAGPQTVPLSALHLRHYVKPHQPRGRRGTNDNPGWVEISFVVGTDGTPRDVHVIGSSAPGVYDEVALGAVNRWRFDPALEAGRAVERRSFVRLRFQSED